MEVNAQLIIGGQSCAGGAGTRNNVVLIICAIPIIVVGLLVFLMIKA